ncbi:putative Fe-S protein YdhL (DUF1289 family) [Rhizobium aethiopicum]|uniref:Putative Fe-S protein YdhL (DUF1289 family) n=2 Tax=Rhizobium aethiopicum TaxID=1138170 RepID=A0A7W6MIQ7_9HYPH|nr:putative Fe-S protein YdhL (DUF1289 family) [Rhizobium aethiopicum]MBB4580604.1 putative Fe-S protein YdhL (DUF1289 family) [Rhizobium aethiopicum]
MNYTDAERRGIMAQLPARLATAAMTSRMKTSLAERPGQSS